MKQSLKVIEIRQAVIEDAAIILNFINELAVYEKLPDEVKSSIEDIENSLFSSHATAHAVICQVDDKPIGFGVYFYNYSTWLGKNGLYLEDLYVSPEHRKIGAGKAILKYLAKLAVSKGCGRVEWCVLNWNEAAIDFYKSIGAKAQDQVTIYRLSGNELKAFVSG